MHVNKDLKVCIGRIWYETAFHESVRAGSRLMNHMWGNGKTFVFLRDSANVHSIKDNRKGYSGIPLRQCSLTAGKSLASGCYAEYRMNIWLTPAE